MTARTLTQHAAIAAQVAALPADVAGYGLIMEAMLHKLEGVPVKSVAFDLAWTLEQAMDVIAEVEEE